ncbi:hypothetical protein SH449x_003199 [Pirellulaceae bacterium SH449]
MAATKMGKIEVTKTHLKWVTWCVLITTILFVIASLNPALNRLEQTAFALLNTARFMMLGCFVTLAVGLVWYRENTPDRVTCAATDSELICTPCDRENVWIVNDEDLAKCEQTSVFTPPAKDLRKIQIVVIRSKEIPLSVLPHLQQLKHLTTLDVQGSTVSADFWNGLERCRDLEHILAMGAIEPSEMKHVHMTLPEAKFYLERRSLVIRR